MKKPKITITLVDQKELRAVTGVIVSEIPLILIPSEESFALWLCM